MEDKQSREVGTTGNEPNPKPGFKSQEKTSLGGDFNSGVTSHEADEKDDIEKQATMKKDQPSTNKKTGETKS
jgi:hypothetical protein